MDTAQSLERELSLRRQEGEMRRHMPSGGAVIGMGTGNISSDSDMFRTL